MYIYLRKLYENDSRGNQISFSKDVALHFFHAPDSFIRRESNYTIHVFHFNNQSVFKDIEIQPATDFRFSTLLNTFLSENGDVINVNDILYVERLVRAFGVKLIKPSDPSYTTFNSLLNPTDRHFLLCDDEPDEDTLDTRDAGETSEIPLENQVIFFGAPGTGKSHEVNRRIGRAKSIRVTFHPDSDYSTFVGSYKPTVNPSDETKLTYSFVPQAFVNAYLQSWLSIDPFYLVIEEINRGNCAQIFGDLFQLLDRDKESGESVYSINPDQDLQICLAREFNKLISKSDDVVDWIPEDILSGETMRLPKNLVIYATMNTSDQSLFPIDSAFKRRWAWHYMAIKNEGKGFVISVNGTDYDWWSFVSDVNMRIGKLTSSEDKKIGYWFTVPRRGSNSIDKDAFVSKVLFYLWNDVFKDYPKNSGNLFNGEWTFQSFFDAAGNVDEGILSRFMMESGFSSTTTGLQEELLENSTNENPQE